MPASSDKIQYALESILEDNLPLLRKGIFSEDEIRQFMAERERLENSLVKHSYRVTDYLSAIEFEYKIERERRYRIKNNSQTIDPYFKKEGKTDFTIVKRIIRLWDRTLHKFKYRVDLWKQYLHFCITIESKKHFQKALSSALSFNPLSVDLWKVGAQFEIEITGNLWKARKIYVKAIKMLNRGEANLEMCLEMLRFEVFFMKTIRSREDYF